MVKDDNSSHHMITRSKNKISNKGIKKNANKKKKKNIWMMIIMMMIIMMIIIK